MCEASIYIYGYYASKAVSLDVTELLVHSDGIGLDIHREMLERKVSS
jgi:hypothetical protein